MWPEKSQDGLGVGERAHALDGECQGVVHIAVVKFVKSALVRKGGGEVGVARAGSKAGARAGRQGTCSGNLARVLGRTRNRPS